MSSNQLRIEPLRLAIRQVESKFRDGVALPADTPNDAEGVQSVSFVSLDAVHRDPELEKMLMQAMTRLVSHRNVDCLLLLGSRGYTFAPIAQILGIPYVMAASSIKTSEPYYVVDGTKEYGTTKLCVLKRALDVFKGKRVLIVDDLLATGGSALAAKTIIEQAGATPVGVLVAVELAWMEEKNVSGLEVFSVFQQQVGDDPVWKKDVEGPMPYVLDSNVLPLYPSSITAGLSTKTTDVIVLSHPKAQRLANAYIRHMNATNGTTRYKLQPIKWGTFTRGIPNCEIFPNDLKDKQVVFFPSFLDEEDFGAQCSVINILPRKNIKSLEIIITYWPYGTMERAERPGIVATADTYGRMLTNSLAPTQSGNTILSIIDPHAQGAQFCFNNDHVSYCDITAMKHFIDIIHQYDELHHACDAIVVVFPDDGAYKRNHVLFREFPVIVCGKKRDDEDPTKRTVTIKDIENVGLRGAPKGDKVFYFIVDDLTRSGRTIKRCAEAIIKYDPEARNNVNACVVHAVFDNHAERDMLDGTINKFYVTDSVPEVAHHLSRLEGDVFEVVPLFPVAPVVPDTLYVMASKNKHKITALSNTLSPYGKYGEVIGIAAPSDVNEQPMGREEGDTGAHNRYHNAVREVARLAKQNLLPARYFSASATAESSEFPKKLAIVAVESYLYWETTDERKVLYEQIAVVITGCKHILGVTPIEIPEQYHKLYYEKVEPSGHTVTLGSCIEEYEGWAPGTWHKHVTGYDRHEYIERLLQRHTLPVGSLENFPSVHDIYPPTKHTETL